MTNVITEPSAIVGSGEGVLVTRPETPWQVSQVLRNSVEVLAVVWTFPIAVLLVGSPIALIIVSLLWVARLALGAF